MRDFPYLRGVPKKYLFDGCKLLWHRDRLLDYLVGKQVMPLHIDMGIHKGCNIKCKYCYGLYQKPSTEYIPTHRLIRLAQEAKEVGVRSIAVIGDGEPTMNKGLYTFIAAAKNLLLDVSVATNGLLLNEDRIKRLTENLVWLRFNISAVSKYDEIHGTKGGLKKFNEIIKLAVKYGMKNDCTIGLQAVLIPEVFDQVVELAWAARAWQVDYLVIKQFSDPGESIPVQFDMDEYVKVKRRLEIAEDLSTTDTRIIAKWSAMKDSRNITKDKKWDFDACIDLPLIFQISGDGTCYPCGYLFGKEEFCYGNIITQNLKEILASNRYWDIIQRVKNTPLAQLCKGQCRHCETNKFVDVATKLYEKCNSVDDTLIEMCGSAKQYQRMLLNEPLHVNFV